MTTLPTGLHPPPGVSGMVEDAHLLIRPCRVGDAPGGRQPRCVTTRGRAGGGGVPGVEAEGDAPTGSDGW